MLPEFSNVLGVFEGEKYEKRALKKDRKVLISSKEQAIVTTPLDFPNYLRDFSSYSCCCSSKVEIIGL